MYLMEYQPKLEDMQINLIQIFRQMVFHNYFQMHDKVVDKFRFYTVFFFFVFIIFVFFVSSLYSF